MDLAGRVVLVTGGARRIGRAIALRLARAGCDIALHYHSSPAEAEQTVAACRAAGVRAVALRADLSDLAELLGLVPQVMSAFGRLDLLINNASDFEPMSLGEFDVVAWERTLRVNLTAPAVLAHAAAGELRSRSGRIVNLCDAAVDRPWPSHLAYVVSKGGLATLTRALARALAPHVNVIGIAPGVADWPEDYTPEQRERLTARIPLGRSGTPEEIAAAVHFVLSEGDFITGEIVRIDGGRHLA